MTQTNYTILLIKIQDGVDDITSINIMSALNAVAAADYSTTEAACHADDGTSLAR